MALTLTQRIACGSTDENTNFPGGNHHLRTHERGQHRHGSKPHAPHCFTAELCGLSKFRCYVLIVVRDTARGSGMREG